MFMSCLEMIMALQKSESDENYNQDLMRASEKLDKVLCVSRIHSLVNGLLQKNGAFLYVPAVTMFWCFNFFFPHLEFSF